MSASWSALTIARNSLCWSHPLRSAAVAVVGGEKVQRHVTPAASLLRVELEDRHEFHDCDAQFFQVGNLLDDSGNRFPAVRDSRRSSGSW